VRLRLRRAKPTETSRLEAFSDGVFAVAITLLALDLGRIHADPAAVPPVTLLDSLRSEWPTLLAFGGAFAFVGIEWTNHRNVFTRVKSISRSLNVANLILLAGVVMVPWATSALAAGLGDSAGESSRQSLLLYAAVAAFGTLAWGLLFHILSSSPDLLEDPGHAHEFSADRVGTVIGLTSLVIATAVGYIWSPLVGAVLLLLVPVIFAVTSEGFERAGSPGPAA